MKKKEHQNSGTLCKDTINNWIIPFLSIGKRGVQWRELPIESYFEKGEISWQNVYYYFNKWSKDGSFQRVMIAMGSPKAGNHNDLYEIEEVLKEILALLEEAGIEHKGLFLNADAGFDSKSLREFLESKEIIANIKPNP